MSELELFDTEELIALIHLDVEEKQWEKALAKCKTGLKREDCPADLYAIAGRLYGQLHLFKHAETQYRRFLEHKPGHLPEHFELGMTLFDQGNLDKALSIWSDVLETDPHHPPSRFYLGIGSIQQGDLARARQHFEVILQRTPPNNFYYSKAREELTRLEEVAIRGQGDVVSDAIN